MLTAQAAHEVPDEMLGSGELIEIVADMIDVMREAPGVGLAAPQIGIPLQVPAYLRVLTSASTSGCTAAEQE